MKQNNNNLNELQLNQQDLQNLNAFNLMLDLTLKGENDIDEHLLTIFSLTISMKPSVIIELGVRTGRSTFPFLFAAHFVGADVTSVDINAVQPDFRIPNNLKSNWSFIQKDAIKFLEDDFQEIMQSYKVAVSGRPKIFYVDDWHSSEHVTKEIELISEFATSEDIIILHDLMYHNSQPHYRAEYKSKDPQWANGGPYDAISKLDLDQWEYATIPRCNGLTILRKIESEICTDME